MKPIILIAITTLALSCGKGNKSCRDNQSGFVPQFYRVFYKTRDFGGGPISIVFTRTEGGITSITSKLYTTVSGQVTCETTTGVFKAGFTTGYDYTYHAYDNSRTWDGKIPASCTPNSCETIEFK